MLSRTPQQFTVPILQTLRKPFCLDISTQDIISCPSCDMRLLFSLESWLDNCKMRNSSDFPEQLNSSQHWGGTVLLCQPALWVPRTVPMLWSMPVLWVPRMACLVCHRQTQAPSTVWWQALEQQRESVCLHSQPPWQQANQPAGHSLKVWEESSAPPCTSRWEKQEQWANPKRLNLI